MAKKISFIKNMPRRKPTKGVKIGRPRLEPPKGDSEPRKASKPDENKEETYKKKDSNTVAWKVTDRGLRSIDRKIENLGAATTINFILLVIILLYLLFFGGMFQ